MLPRYSPCWFDVGGPLGPWCHARHACYIQNIISSGLPGSLLAMAIPFTLSTWENHGKVDLFAHKIGLKVGTTTQGLLRVPVV